mmetsp:Transcript_16429/g.11571  ORF Transcript_16429/g.11571 Transcript_16429/m.11571 type:complete len:184 (-) Transcript_16429:544-1095(-)
MILKLWRFFRYNAVYDNYIDYSLEKLLAYDAIHFKGTATVNPYKGSYRFETNQAFFPFYPYLVNTVMNYLDLEEHRIMRVGFCVNLALGLANTLLIYKCGKKFFKDENVATISGYLYIFSSSLVYHVSMYSENTFLFFGLLGVYTIDGGDSNRNWPKSCRIVASSILFGMSAAARSTGTLFSI